MASLPASPLNARKTCTGCRRDQAIDQFSHKKTTKTTARCLTCRNAAQQARQRVSQLEPPPSPSQDHAPPHSHGDSEPAAVTTTDLLQMPRTTDLYQMPQSTAYTWKKWAKYESSRHGDESFNDSESSDSLADEDDTEPKAIPLTATLQQLTAELQGYESRQRNHEKKHGMTCLHGVGARPDTYFKATPRIERLVDDMNRERDEHEQARMKSLRSSIILAKTEDLAERQSLSSRNMVRVAAVTYCEKTVMTNTLVAIKGVMERLVEVRKKEEITAMDSAVLRALSKEKRNLPLARKVYPDIDATYRSLESHLHEGIDVAMAQYVQELARSTGMPLGNFEDASNAPDPGEQVASKPKRKSHGQALPPSKSSTPIPRGTTTTETSSTSRPSPPDAVEGISHPSPPAYSPRASVESSNQARKRRKASQEGYF